LKKEERLKTQKPVAPTGKYPYGSKELIETPAISI
jgi:hypothetical protein